VGAYSQTRRELVAFTREPALAIWQATKCLAEIHARTETPDVSAIIAEAEIILLGLMLALIRRPDVSGSAPALTKRRRMSNVKYPIYTR
jgi:hypothetical protein